MHRLPADHDPPLPKVSLDIFGTWPGQRRNKPLPLGPKSLQAARKPSSRWLFPTWKPLILFFMKLSWPRAAFGLFEVLEAFLAQRSPAQKPQTQFTCERAFALHTDVDEASGLVGNTSGVVHQGSDGMSKFHDVTSALVHRRMFFLFFVFWLF
jgi:hypothetical protein